MLLFSELEERQQRKSKARVSIQAVLEIFEVSETQYMKAIRGRFLFEKGSSSRDRNVRCFQADCSALIHSRFTATAHTFPLPTAAKAYA